jgi:hypothetical protein
VFPHYKCGCFLSLVLSSLAPDGYVDCNIILVELSIIHIYTNTSIKQTKLRGLGPRANYTDRATAACSAKLVPNFEDSGCHVVSAADPLLPCFRLSRPELLFFLPSSSSVVLTRLSGPRSRRTTLRKSGSVGNRAGPLDL